MFPPLALLENNVLLVGIICGVMVVVWRMTADDRQLHVINIMKYRKESSLPSLDWPSNHLPEFIYIYTALYIEICIAIGVKTLS